MPDCTSLPAPALTPDALGGPLFEHARDALLLLDAQGRVSAANPAAALLLGEPTEALRARPVSHWDLDPGDPARHDPSTWTPGESRQRRLRRSDGSTCSVDSTMSRLGPGASGPWLWQLRDRGEQDQLESALAECRERLAERPEAHVALLQQRSDQLDALLALCPDGLVAFDAEQRVVRANRAFLHLSGLRTDEILGLTETEFSGCLERISMPGARFPGVAELRAARRREQVAATTDDAPVRRPVFELAHPPGRCIELALCLGHPGPLSQLLVLRDVSREQAVDRLKSEFLSQAARELRTPMTSIFGYAELLRVRDYTPRRRAELASIIGRQSEAMLAVVDELLELARIESRHGADFEFERLSLRELLDQSLARFVPPAGRQPPVIDDDGETRLVLGDRERLHQALMNLLSNAYRFSPAGGEVRVSLLRSAGAERTQVGLQVQDRGVGLSPEQLARVGERFYRVNGDGPTGGTGLSVAITKEILALHRGHLALQSQPGQGTTATMWLPSV